MSELVERLSKEVHDSWWRSQRDRGYLDYTHCGCPICSKESLVNTTFKGPLQYKMCCGCGQEWSTHVDMIPYEELDEIKKEVDRITVRTVLFALNKSGYSFKL